MKKLLFALMFFVLPSVFGTVWAVDYLFYAEGCEHCQDVLDFVEEHKLDEQFNLELREVRNDKENIKLFGEYLKKHNLSPEQTYVPFLVIDEGEYCEYMHGKKAIANYYASKLDMDEVCLA